MSTTNLPRARRADAERNRDRILIAARAAFADSDGQASMAEISRRAGVGMATLYRNFPGRQELLEALFTAEVDAVCQAAQASGAGTPGARLTEWLRQFLAFFTNKHQIAAELLKHTSGSDPVFGGNRARVIAAGRPLLIEAQQAHEIRDDVSLEQVLDMIIAVASIQADADYIGPIVQTAMDGLRPSPGTESS